MKGKLAHFVGIVLNTNSRVFVFGNDYFINWAIVKEQQCSVEMPFCVMITTDDLALKDAVHFTTESYQIIGKSFTEAYLNLIQGQACLSIL